jgi:hypothetical protein
MDRGGIIRGRRPSAYLPAAGALALVAAIAASSRAGALDRIVVVIVLGLWSCFFVAHDAGRIAEGRLPLGVPTVLVILPFVHVMLGWGGWVYVFQAAAVGLLTFYLSLMRPDERMAVVRRALPLLAPLFLLVCLVTLSYAASSSLSKHDLFALLNLWSALAFALLAALYCRTLADLKRLTYVIIAGAMLQVPVVLAQAIGLADHLPGALAQLSPANWGGSLAGRLGPDAGGAIVTRYPGSFGSAENFAEYCGIVLLLCLGLFLFERDTRRAFVLAAAGVALAVTGWFTGTRSFLFGVAGGTCVLLLAVLLQPGARASRVWRLAVGLGLTSVVVVLFVPSVVTAGFLSRLTNPQVSLSGPNALNRMQLFRTWVKVAGHMPLLGFGTRMRDVVYSFTALGPVEWPHSLYFWALLTAGFLGLFAVIVLVVIAVILPIKTAFLEAPLPYRELGSVFAAVTLYWAVNEAKIEFVRLPFYVDFVFFFFGVVASLYVLSRDSVADDAEGGRRSLSFERPREIGLISGLGTRATTRDSLDRHHPRDPGANALPRPPI